MPRSLSVILILALLVLPIPGRAQSQEIPAQNFTLDPGHSALLFSVTHLGLSNFTAGFDDVTARLYLDPQDPESARLRVDVNVRSLDLPMPPPGFFETMMRVPWFQAERHPVMTYVSDRITLTSGTTARVDGTLTLNGISAPLPLNARFNTGFPAGVIEPHARVGFSADAELNRSAYGLGFGIPAEGSTFGVGDNISVRIEAEFVGETIPE